MLTVLCMIFLRSGTVNAQNTEEPLFGIEHPAPGEAIQGLSQITGFIELAEWKTYNLEFAFSQKNVWFPISMSVTLIEGNLLGEWDTSSISDGNYDLRLTVFLDDDFHNFKDRGFEGKKLLYH